MCITLVTASGIGRSAGGSGAKTTAAKIRPMRLYMNDPSRAVPELIIGQDHCHRRRLPSQARDPPAYNAYEEEV